MPWKEVFELFFWGRRNDTYLLTIDGLSGIVLEVEVPQFECRHGEPPKQ